MSHWITLGLANSSELKSKFEFMTYEHRVILYNFTDVGTYNIKSLENIGNSKLMQHLVPIIIPFDGRVGAGLQSAVNF